MSFVDDLGKAVKIFSDGAESLAQTQAFNRATEQINEINANMKDGMEKRQALQGATQNLAQELLQANAPVSKIQQAFQAFGPTPVTSGADDIRAGVEFQDPNLVTKGQEKQLAGTEVETLRSLQLLGQKQKIKQAGLAGEEADRINDSVIEAARDFKGQPDIKEFLKQRQAVSIVSGFIEAGTGDVTELVGGIKGMIRLSGEQRISDADFKHAGVNQSLWGKARRTYNKLLKGEAVEEDREVVSAIAKSLMKKTQQTLDKRIGSFAKARAKSIRGADASQLETRLRNEFGIPKDLFKMSDTDRLNQKFLGIAQKRGISEQQLKLLNIAKQVPNDPKSQKVIESFKKIFSKTPEERELLQQVLGAK